MLQRNKSARFLLLAAWGVLTVGVLSAVPGCESDHNNRVSSDRTYDRTHDRNYDRNWDNRYDNAADRNSDWDRDRNSPYPR